MTALAFVSLAIAAIPAILYFCNIALFRPPPKAVRPYSISVLIPARNEEAVIAACVESVLANRGVELECIVMDDGSTDRTGEIVRGLVERDGRVRLELAPPLPTGWSGKQHACHELSKRASHTILTFLDADVRLAPDALARLAAFRQTAGVSLVSGFPRQETGTILEKLVIPLIHFLLLGYLPFLGMRRTTRRSFGAGCGQWFLTTREAYERVGGHAHPRVRGSFHDGLQLPRAYRECGLKSDLCDATDLATCRMYRTAGQVWNGLAKNAREGLAAPRMIVFGTALLFFGQVLPFVLLPFSPWAIPAAALAIAPRVDAAFRFRQPWLGVPCHPLGVLALLGIQWYATMRAMAGRRANWKGREQPVGSPNETITIG